LATAPFGVAEYTSAEAFALLLATLARERRTHTKNRLGAINDVD
jgi:hypothetical protein